MTKLVAIESPFSGNVERNIIYARRCVAHSLAQGEAPIASHLLYTQPGILDDTIQDERSKGMQAGWAWNRKADMIAVYIDYGISNGMLQGIERTTGVQIIFRKIGENP